MVMPSKDWSGQFDVDGNRYRRGRILPPHLQLRRNIICFIPSLIVAAGFLFILLVTFGGH